jgi:hypothetical protein
MLLLIAVTVGKSERRRILSGDKEEKVFVSNTEGNPTVL